MVFGCVYLKKQQGAHVLQPFSVTLSSGMCPSTARTHALHFESSQQAWRHLAGSQVPLPAGVFHSVSCFHCPVGLQGGRHCGICAHLHEERLHVGSPPRPVREAAPFDTGGSV